MKMPPNGTPEDQNQILQNLSSQGYDAIAVSVIAPKDQLRILNEVAAKTNLITFDSDADKSKRLLYIGTNNFAAGQALGERIVKLLAGRRQDRGVRGHALDRQRVAAPGRHRSARSKTTRSKSSTGAKTTPTAPRPAPTSKTSSTPTRI